MGKRGELTEQISNKMENFFQRPTSTEELRLIPYIHYCAINSQRVDIAKINRDERAILADWKNRGLLEGGASSPIFPTREFYNLMCEVLFDAYVDFREAPARADAND